MKSRLIRHTERTMKRNIFFSLAGTVGIIIFMAIFGIPLLTNMSIGIDKLRGSSPTNKETQTNILLPPILDPAVIATNSSIIKISGKGQPDMTVFLYINESETKKALINKDGLFSFESVQLKEGNNTISAKQTDGKASTSELSNAVSIIYKKEKPKLDIEAPTDNTTITGEKNSVTMSGKTDNADVTVSVNERLIIVKADGSFSYDYSLPEGDTILKITAIDIAGNQSVVERKVTYRK